MIQPVVNAPVLLPRPVERPPASPVGDRYQAGGAAAPAAARPPALPVGNPEEMARQLEALVQLMLTDPEAEKQMIQLVARLNATGQLRPVLHKAAAAAAEAGKLPPMPDQKRAELVDQLAGMIDAQLREHGMTPGTHGQVYKAWDDMAREHVALVQASAVLPRSPGEPSAFGDPRFVAELEKLQGSRFVAGNRVTPLIDGPESFAVRDRLIEGATKSIHLMTWAFYDDATGWETARKLAAKAAEGVEVRVVVDGQVADRAGHGETLAFLEANGVQVVRWRDGDRPYDGQHRKVMIVDGQAAVAGGLNVGDFYSHRGPEGSPRWRDTDVLIEGPAVADCERLFARVAGLRSQVVAPDPVGSMKAAVVNHDPGPKGDHHILLATMKAIQGASETVDIENAYYIETPGIKRVILDALARGVRVRILTNSSESVDEPIVSAPILRSLPELVAAGAEVYVKRGDTLHSKFLVVDGVYSSVGSYNLHPRSERHEGEMTVNTLDAATAGHLTTAFERDLAAARRITSPDEVKVPENLFTILAARYFFDQL